jgi:hypothetical protein
MLWWLESQDTAVIALLVFAFCYLLAAVILGVAVAFSRHPVSHELSATTPAMLTPLGVITGLVIAFLSARVWSNVDRAQSYVAREASAIREVVLIAEVLPSQTRDTIRNDVSHYLHFVDTEDWPAMLYGRANLRRLPPGLSDAQTTLLSFAPQGPGQELAQRRATNAVEAALQARRDRILLSEAAISPPQWVVIIVLDALILVTIAMVHVRRHTTTAINMLIFSTAVAACMVLLMINDRPFNAGGITVLPTALHEVGPE